MDAVFWNETLHFSLFHFLFFNARSASLQIVLGVFGKARTHSLRLQTFRFGCLHNMSLFHRVSLSPIGAIVHFCLFVRSSISIAWVFFFFKGAAHSSS